MKENNIALLLISSQCRELAITLQRELSDSIIYTKVSSEIPHSVQISSFAETMSQIVEQHKQIIVIGALGICVRLIAPYVQDKYYDPAVICVDSTGQFIIPVLSGHVGGANEWATCIANILGGIPVITTQSDNEGLWALDTLARTYNWYAEADHETMNQIIFAFVQKKNIALLLEVKDQGTAYLERTKPVHVDIFYHMNEINKEEYTALIAVTPHIYETGIPSLFFRPKVLHIGIGCRKMCYPDGIPQHIFRCMTEIHKLSPRSIKSIGTIEQKKEEPLLPLLQSTFYDAELSVYTAEEIQDIPVPNPSENPQKAVGVPSVAEACAIASSHHGLLLVEKQKGCLQEGADFTYAVALEKTAIRRGHIEIVGAGPGDPELVSVRGKRFLEQADLILYAGSLVPIELTHYAKQGAVVRSSADMNLEEQFAIMKEFYDRGLLVVRLHTGDPCIYGAIQEQMAYFDRYGMSYHITPGISSFQAAAAALNSQFTIPEKVQTIILTRGEGRTPMPEKEQLHKLAQSQSTMCIYLSAGIVEKVQAELLQAYPPTTPVAVCYKLTWKDEKIYRCTLQDMAKTVRENNLTLTTLLVIGDAIDNRQGLSRLYADEFKHLFRK